jgi:hypothetical protein
MMQALRFALAAWRAYRLALKHGSAYVGIANHGIPEVTCFVAVGREAWRVSKRAIEEFTR